MLELAYRCCSIIVFIINFKVVNVTINEKNILSYERLTMLLEDPNTERGILKNQRGYWQ